MTKADEGPDPFDDSEEGEYYDIESCFYPTPEEELQQLEPPVRNAFMELITAIVDLHQTMGALPDLVSRLSVQDVDELKNVVLNALSNRGTPDFIRNCLLSVSLDIVLSGTKHPAFEDAFVEHVLKEVEWNVSRKKRISPAYEDALGYILAARNDLLGRYIKTRPRNEARRIANAISETSGLHRRRTAAHGTS